VSNSAETSHVEIANQDSLITGAPMAHFYGRKVGTDTYHHEHPHPSTLRLHERPASDRSSL
jgi:hypothetical protein